MEPLQIGEVCRVTTHEVGFGGVGVARHSSGVVCLVPKTLPGETIEGRVVRRRKRMATIWPEQWVTKSPLRVDPACRYFSECGGCHFQNLQYAEQLALKGTILNSNLARRLGDLKFELHDVVGSDQPLGYRNKNFFHVEKESLGFVDPYRASVLRIDECLVAGSQTNRLLQLLQAWFQGLPKENRECLLDIMIRENDLGDLMVILVVDEKSQATWNVALLTTDCQELSVYTNRRVSTSKQAFGATFEHLAGPTHIRDRIGPFAFELSPSCFAQVNRQVADKLYRQVVAELNPLPHQWHLDLYSGSGTLAMYLAKRSAGVYAVEMNHLAIADAKQSQRLNGIDNIEWRAGKCATILRKLLGDNRRFPLATLNPPRTGLERDLAAMLPKLGIERFVYVSCSPPTLIRDCENLIKAGYVLKKIIPYDMFAQTYHLELLCLFERPAI